MAWLAVKGRKIKLKNVLRMCIYEYLYMRGSNKANVTYI